MWEQHREVNRCSREVSSEWVGKKQELLTKAESLASRLTGCWSADLCVSTWALMMTWRNVHKVQMKNWWLKKWTLIERKAEVQTWTLENVRTNRSSDRQECKAKYKAHEISRKSLTSNLETEWRQDKQTEGINHQCKWQNQDWERKLEHQTLNIQTAENKPSLDFSHLYHCKLRIFHKNTNTGEEDCVPALYGRRRRAAEAGLEPSRTRIMKAWALCLVMSTQVWEGQRRGFIDDPPDPESHMN